MKGIYTRSNGDNTLNIITHQQHNISRQQISSNALKVLYRLNQAGFEAFLVGGGVRDLLLGLQPKDFDIATNATPEQVRQLFRNCRLIGRRFRLAHVMFGREIIEVATFRGHHQIEGENEEIDDDNLEQLNETATDEIDSNDPLLSDTDSFVDKKSLFDKTASAAQSEQGMLLRDNVYGSVEEDAERRDFTINAMYYNVADYSIHDYANGLEDLEDRLVRLIGNPETRYREDPVRMLRAIRFAVKLDFDIEEETAEPIEELAHLLKDIPSARLYEESLKLLQSGHGLEAYHLMRQYNLFQQLFPTIAQHFTADYDSQTEQMIDIALDSTDIRIEEEKRVNPAFMFAAMLWYPLQERIKSIMADKKLSHYDAMLEASNDILDEQIKTIAIPRRHTTTIREIWQLQQRLPRREGKRAARLLELAKFRAGFDFLVMRSEIEGGETELLAKWWQTYQNAGGNMRHAMVNDLNQARPSRRRKTTQRHKNESVESHDMTAPSNTHNKTNEL